MPTNNSQQLPRYPEKPAPVQLPEMGRGGISYQSDDIVFNLYPAGTSEYHCVSPMESVIFSLGPAQKWASAFNSDKLVSGYTTPNGIGYCLKDAQVYSVNLEAKPQSHHLAVSFPPAFRQAIEEEVGDVSASLRTVCNLHSTLSTALLIRQIQAFLGGGFSGGKLIAESLANMAVIQGLQALVQLSPPVKSTRLSKRSLTRTLEFIEANLHRNIGLKDLADVAAISVYHFARCFKNTHGLTPGAYLTERRIARAKELLGKTQTPVSDIAPTCGFSSQSYFTSVFKHHTGATPLQYRKRVRN